MAVLYYYGAKRDTPDHRDKTKVYAQSDISPKHPNVSLKKYVDHVYDQGSISSCTANALCAAYGLDLKKQQATLGGGYYYFNPSRLFLYYNTREAEHTTQLDAGASIRATIKSLNRKGVCKEELWPYKVANLKTKPPNHIYNNAKLNNLCKYERLHQDIHQFRTCLKDNCPFVFGFKVYRSFLNTPRSGVMAVPTGYERTYNDPLGLHAVTAVGYNDREKHIIVLNSWGVGWGDQGYFYMPYDFIVDSNMCFDFWKITFACEAGKKRPEDTVVSGSGACGYGGMDRKAHGYRY